MDSQPLMPWIIKTIQQIRKHSDRRIIIRFHPGDKHNLKHRRMLARYRLPNVVVSHAANIQQDFMQTHALVNYNSSPAVASAIEGVPIFVADPDDCQAKDVANIDFKNIEKPDTFDREQWLQKLSMCHWNFEELSSGKAWRHMREYI